MQVPALETRVSIQHASPADANKLTTIQARTFRDDNRLKPAGCSLEGPPRYDSPAWNAAWIKRTPYWKILLGERVVGGAILFRHGNQHIELGRIYIDPIFQNRGIGQRALRLLFVRYPQTRRWTLGTPAWARRNQHSY